MEAMPKFTESKAFTFFNAMQIGFKDLDIVRHFVKSMKEWDKELINARNRNKAPEME